MDVYSSEVNSYMLTISNNGHIERFIICCEDWFEPVSDIASPMDNDYKLYIPSDEELKKSVIVNVPIDMEVSTHESNERITINVQHKEEKVEKQKFKNGDIIYVQERAGGYIAIFQNMRDDVINIHAVLHIKTGLVYTNLNGAEILIKKNILSIRVVS